MITALHWLLALASAAIMALAGIEAGVRVAQNRKPGVLAARAFGGALLLLGLTAAGGLGTLVGGGRPHEGLHFLYAVLAFGAIPVASVLAGRAAPRGQATATLIGALIGLVLIVRLFMTG